MAVDIQITEKYKLTTDNNSWRVEKRQVIKGVESFSPLSYHHTPEQALRYTARRLVRDSEARSFKELIQAAEKVSDIMSGRLEQALQEFKAITGEQE